MQTNQIIFKSIRHMLERAAYIALLASAALVIASGAFLTGAGAALAPEPARVKQALSGSTGTSGAAYYVNSSLDVRVFKWAGSYTYASNPPAAGTPCSTTDLAAYTDTARVIVASGNYRKCM